jgi:hypothetical protein
MMENYRMASLYARAFSGGAEMFAGVCSTHGQRQARFASAVFDRLILCAFIEI